MSFPGEGADSVGTVKVRKKKLDANVKVTLVITIS